MKLKTTNTALRMPALICLFALLSTAATAAPFVRGDTNLDRQLGLGDAVGTLRYLFTGEDKLTCRAAADVNTDGAIGMDDGLHTLRHLFLGGAEPHAPFPDCGEDESVSPLGCEIGLDCESSRVDLKTIKENSLSYYKSNQPCHPYEPQPCEPGPCTVEVHIEQIQVTSGQGFSEGMLELNLASSVDAGPGGLSSSVWPGALDTQKVDVGHSKTIGDLVASFEIGPNETRSVDICFDVVEEDGGLVNGKNDVGRVCTTVLVSCGTVIHDTVRAKLCRGDKRDKNGNCKDFNGQVAIDFTVYGGDDVDCDDVPNIEDMAPEPCDDANLGQRGGRALICYFDFRDGPVSTLFQEVGTNLNNVMDGYDYIVLLKQDKDFIGLTLSAKAVNQANLVLDPTADNFYEAFRDVVSKGYSLDFVSFCHGGQYTGVLNDAWFETMDGTLIDATWIATNLGDPAVTGAHAIPMVMSYSVACYLGRLNSAWLGIGAKCAGAASRINFYPTKQSPFTNDWNAGSTYGDAVANAEASANRFIVDAFVTAGSLDNLAAAALTGAVPAGCTLNVLGQNDCAEWYFEDGTADAGGPYDFDGTYDASQSGKDNMVDSSVHVTAGNANVTKFSLHTW